MKLYIVRHGETYANVEKRYVGFTDSELTEKGKKQIQNLRKTMGNIKLKKTYCSPSIRTRKTAEILGFTCAIDERLREMNFGILEGMTYDEIMKKQPEIGNRFFSEWNDYKIPEGESYIEVRNRVKDFINRLDEEDTLIITHGGWIRAFIAEIEAEEIDIWDLDIKVGCLIEVKKDDERFEWKIIR
ncbi:MAG: histidine phosphatase family protein [Alkaliphilus sp.]